MIDRGTLQRLFPRPLNRSKAEIWDGYVDAILADWPALSERYGITTPSRLGLLLATWGTETGGLTIIWENMSYSAPRMLEIFGQGRHSAGITPAEARRLAHKPRAIAERAYGLGNPRKAAELGNREPGDGYKYRGWGIGQITGRRDHEKYIAGDYTYRRAILAALDEWEIKGCNAVCDGAKGPADLTPLRSVRRKINGGLNGWGYYREYAAAAHKIWPWDGAPPPDPLADGTLSIGERGPAVTDLQSKLASAGHPVGKVDGRFGAITEDSVRAYQARVGLDVTGIADQATLDSLSAPPPSPRRDVTADDLAKTSSTWSIASAVQWVGRLIFGGSALAAGDAAGGLGVVEQGVAQADRVKGLLGRLGDVLGPYARYLPEILAFGVLIGVGLLLMRWAGALKTERLEKAASGVDLSH